MARYTDVDYDRDRRYRSRDYDRRSDYEPGPYGRNRNADRYNMRDRDYDYYAPGGWENYGYDRDEARDRSRWGRNEYGRFDRDYGNYDRENRTYGTYDRDYDRTYRRYDRDYDRSRDYDYRDRGYGRRMEDYDRDYDRNRDYYRDRDRGDRAWNGFGYGPADNRSNESRWNRRSERRREYEPHDAW